MVNRMVRIIVSILFLSCVAVGELVAFVGNGEERPNFVRPIDGSLLRFNRKQEFLRAIRTDYTLAQEKRNREMQAANGQENTQIKSRKRAFFQSLFIPGWGQDYADSKTAMKVFIATETAVWASFIGFTVWSNWLENDFRTFATTHADVNVMNKPEQYFVDIGNYANLSDYNQAQLRGRDVSGLYPENEEFFWSWDNDENRRRFENMRIRSDRASNRAGIAVAAIFLNHLVSAIHSTLAVHRFNERKSSELGWRMYMNAAPSAVHVTLSKSF